jgi:DNA-binding transcriptional LysR family regulator
MRDELRLLSAFLAVAEERSFTKAAKRLGVSSSAMSHAIRELEDRVGLRLLSRTTRSVAPTEAGQQFLTRLRPALGGVHEALDELSSFRDRPTGRLKLLVPRFAIMMVLEAKVGRFAREYPDIVLDVTANDSRVDLVAGGFDAGIQLGEYINRDMVAVRVSPDFRAAIVGAPSYFAAHSTPNSPRDLVQHQCIGYRHGSAGIYQWEFDKGDQSLTVAVAGPLIVDEPALLVRAALDGVGLAYVTEAQVAEHLDSGTLVRVLEDWCQPFPGFFLYYPSRRHPSAALSALIETLRR